MRRLLTNLLLASFSLFCGLLMAEGVLRLVRPEAVSAVTPGLYELDPPRRYRLQPGYRGELSNLTEFDTEVRISAQGLRDEEVGPKAPGERRLLVLGDSFVFGWGVEREEALAARLGSELEGSSPGWRVINGGVPGYGLPDVVDAFEAWGLDLEPDAVVVAIYLGNDILDATEEHRRMEIEDGLVAEEGAAKGFRAWIYRHSHLVRLGKRALPIGLQSRVRELLGLPQPWSFTYLRSNMKIYHREPTPLVEEGMAASREALERLEALAAEREIEVALVLLPHRRSVEPGRWDATLQSLGLDPEQYDKRRPADFFTGVAADLDLPILDLSPTLREAVAEGRDLYFEHDPHWRPETHELSARELVDFLESAGILDEP